jgi:hypothetical protein
LLPITTPTSGACSMHVIIVPRIAWKQNRPARLDD